MMRGVSQVHRSRSAGGLLVGRSRASGMIVVNGRGEEHRRPRRSRWLCGRWGRRCSSEYRCNGRSRLGCFTLIELLVVVAIIAILAAFLMPALQNAREQGKRAVCLSNMHQMYLALQSYASDNNGFFPIIDWPDFQLFVNPVVDSSGAVVAWQSWGGWMPQYFPVRNVLRCPGMDPTTRTPPTWWGYDPQYDLSNPTWWTSYTVLAATGDQVPSTSTFYGLQLFHGSTQGGTNGMACPNTDFPGRTISGYGAGGDWYGSLYIAPAAEQPAILDLFKPNGGWYPYSFYPTRTVRNNHWTLNGENIVFLDGHGEWRTASRVSPRFQIYGQMVYW